MPSLVASGQKLTWCGLWLPGLGLEKNFEDGLHRALRAALQQCQTMHAGFLTSLEG